MKRLCLAAAAGLVPLAAHAQFVPPPNVKAAFEPIVVTASRALQPEPTLRDAVVITREDLEDSGALSLGEVLERRAGVELRATGGPGQPQGIFMRGASAANTLVLVDGIRVGSATQGTTAIEAIPLELIERIEIVKGPLSSLYGSEAAGGVIQIFTRGKDVPYFFASGAVGTDRDLRASSGLATSDGDNLVSLTMGARRVDAKSATNERNTFSYDPDRDPYENAYANLRMSHRYWQGETLMLEAFGSHNRTHYDAGIPPPGVTDRTDQSVAGWRITSSNNFAKWWASRLAVGEGLDDLKLHGQFTNAFRTRSDQASWINQFGAAPSSATLGWETVRQTVTPSEADGVPLYTQNHRTTNSVFGSLLQTLNGQHLEASARRDQDEQFGARNTGSVSYGIDFPGYAQLAGTWGRGFRAPTFNDLYLAAFAPFYVPNPNLKPERSKSGEISLRSLAGAKVSWRVTAFDNRFDDLIVATAQSVDNVDRARIRGVEAALDATWWGLRFRASLTVQRPRNDDTGARLQGRAERFGNVDVSRAWGRWTAGIGVLASSDRYDSATADPATRLGGYAVVDARVRYAITPKWTAELVATNLGDKRYESSLGYDAPRRGVLLNVRFASY
jgi:vitamin B12 transporter